jgi:D-alanyl-D-alanine carboxypeptidase
MLWIRAEALRGLRWGVLGFASVALMALSSGSSLAAPYSDIVLDANSGKVLHATNPDAKRHPASLTKIMTLYLLFEQLEVGALKLDTQLEVSEDAAEQSPTKLGLRAGNTISVEDAIKGLVTRSANDAAVVIAEWIGDDEESFAELMTKKARALGMMHTVYKNASGLPNDEQVTTARDQAILGRAIQEHFPRYYKYFATRSFRYQGHSIRNHNSLLGRVEGVDGIKTGYIRASGFNLLTSVHRGNRYLVAVVMGGNSAGSRDARMRELIGDYLEDAATKRTVAMIPRPAVEPETTVDATAEAKVAATTEAEPETKVAEKRKPTPEPKVAAKPESKSEPKAAAKDEPKPKPKVAAKSEPKASTIETKSASKDQHRFAVASAGASLVRTAPASEPSVTAAIPTTGASDPIRPILVKTLTVKSNMPARTGSFAPVNASAAAAPKAQEAPPPAAAPAAKAETPPSPPPAPPSVTAALPQPKSAAVDGAPAASTKQRESAAAVPEKPTRSGWMIQVGAFKSDDDAKERISAVQSKASKLLAGTDPFTETVEKGGSTYYRARFVGFDKNSAEAACKFLKRNDVECLTVRN